MRWVLTWKLSEETGEYGAKARLVIKGFTDPDLTTLRAEAPTLSKGSRHLILQTAASSHFTVEVGDVKTAFLQGDKTEQDRDVFVEPVPEFRQKLGMTQKHVLRLMGSAYGLRTAPRTWYQRVKKDLTTLGWRMHQLDQCTFMMHDGKQLIGIIGVYVDDFLIAGDIQDPRWIQAKKALKDLYNWGKMEHDQFYPLWNPVHAVQRLCDTNDHE